MTRGRAESGDVLVDDSYQPLFELAGVGLAQIDPETYRFLRVNRRLCTITGYSEQELLARTPIEITHPDDWHADRPAFESLLRGDFTEHVVEKRYLRKDGSLTWVMVTLNPIREANGRLARLVSVVRDIDRRVRIEEDLQKRNRSLAFVSETATRLLMADRPEGEIPGIISRLAGLLELEIYESHVFDQEGGRLHLLTCSQTLEPFREEFETLELGQFTSGTVAQQRRPIVLEDAQRSTDPVAVRVREIGMTAWVCHPLLAGAKLVGTMALGTRGRPTFAPGELELVRTTCDQVAMALERRRLAREIERRASELSAANNAKDQFLAALSHELRTPLTPVLLTASSMETDPSLPRTARDEIAAIRQNVELEARLIDDLLDLTRVARGKMELEVHRVDMHELVYQAIRTVAGEAGEKKLIVTTDLNAPRSTVLGDAARLQQILLNLLKNAIKFTPEGGTITVWSANDERDVNCLVLEVIDTGIGIPEELLPKIFDAFEQGSPSITRRFGGLGLGLAISRGLATAHGAALTARSAGKDRGSTFTLVMPTAVEGEVGEAPEATEPCVAPAADPTIPQARLRILLVEDHPSTASTLARLLRKLGHDVSVAAGVRRALDLAGKSPVDLLISDIGLPDGTGHELMRELRQMRPELMAIALSGYGTEEDIQRSLEAGFSQHLTKPINLEQLKALTNRPV